ncbi:MAG: hypothetical protein HOP17_04705 [Acidobacteria bacterium]|nr:hypothetical protein [Acidobacteriota bacterium]
MKFLHISDIHLGCTRYNLPESQRDFFDAWVDVLKKYAIGEKVDFVIMCGDFFHKRTVPPETMDYAFAGLSLLRDAGIPVVAIEGNHDQKHSDTPYSWLRSLEKWRLLHLLEPKSEGDGFIYEPWDYDRDDYINGGYIDIGRARIFGSAWYGGQMRWAVPRLTEAIKANHREGAFHMLMLHTDVEGHQKHPLPAISVAALKELKSAVDYVGLGHTHMHYEIENWAFNPGSIEVTNISEFRETRGVFVVEVGEDNSINARHVQDYHQRPFERFNFKVDGYAETTEITEGILEKVNSRLRYFQDGGPQPIIEIKLTGRLGIPNSMLEMQKIRDEVKKSADALHVLIKNHTTPVEYAVAEDVEEDASREIVERRVIEDLVVRDNRFKGKSEQIARLVVGVKRQALGDESPEKIADLIGQELEADREAEYV